jgi:hypothetical protein
VARRNRGVSTAKSDFEPPGTRSAGILIQFLHPFLFGFPSCLTGVLVSILSAIFSVATVLNAGLQYVFSLAELMHIFWGGESGKVRQ